MGNDHARGVGTQSDPPFGLARSPRLGLACGLSGGCCDDAKRDAERGIYLAALAYLTYKLVMSFQADRELAWVAGSVGTFTWPAGSLGPGSEKAVFAAGFAVSVAYGCFHMATYLGMAVFNDVREAVEDAKQEMLDAMQQAKPTPLQFPPP